MATKFRFIGEEIESFLSKPDGRDFIEEILQRPTDIERGRLFMSRYERIRHLDYTTGRLWKFSGSTLVLGRSKDKILHLINSLLSELLIAGRHSLEVGFILKSRSVPLACGDNAFDLFVNVVLLPEICILMSARIQFGNYSDAEREFLKFSALYIKKVIYV